MGILEIFSLLGGLGLFIYGMDLMSKGLKIAAGDKLQRILEKMTSNRLLGVTVGAGVTAVIQSSSATTVMVVGFVNAGLMTLLQASGIIMGANIGTTITGQLVSIDLGDYAPLLMFIGMVLVTFVKNKMWQKIGTIVVGFGMLFIGITMMGAAASGLKTDPNFQNILLMFDNPILAVVAGALFTAIVQSSSAAIGLLLTFATQGLIDLQLSAFIVFGMNIGTCITAILAALSSSKESQRAALFHVMFNVIGTIFFGLLIFIFPQILDIFVSWDPGNFARQIANFHTAFNVCNTVLLFPFAKLIVKLVEKLIPKREEDEEIARSLVYLDKNIMQTPAIAVTQAKREVVRMGRIAVDNLQLALDAFFTKDADKAAKVLNIEETINFLNHSITGVLVQLGGLNLPEKDLEKLSMMFHVVSDIERIGDHAENIAEYTNICIEHKIAFSPDAMNEIVTLSNRSLEVLNMSIEVYEEENKSLLRLVHDAEENVDAFKDLCVENHIDRLMKEHCEPRTGVMFTDMVTDLERCADHATNIAYAILGETTSWEQKKQYLFSQLPEEK